MWDGSVSRSLPLIARERAPELHTVWTLITTTEFSKVTECGDGRVSAVGGSCLSGISHTPPEGSGAPDLPNSVVAHAHTVLHIATKFSAVLKLKERVL